MEHRENISSRFSRNSEAFASEFPEDHEEMFPWYYVQVYVTRL